jgi:cytochrome bd-type quinol oxidase subunit 2
MRVAVGAQVVAILTGWFQAQAPVLLRTEGGPLTLRAAAGPPITMLWLAIGLTVVLALVIPPLVWLYRVFDSTRS